jgi:RNA polymerase sigma-70 factor, ECF subfamily
MPTAPNGSDAEPGAGIAVFELVTLGRSTSRVDGETLAQALALNLDGAFEELVRCFQDRVYGFALRHSGNAQDAEEIAQDTFFRAYRALCGYTPERIESLSLRPWLYQIALNAARNRFRGRRLQTVPFELDGATPIDPPDDDQAQPEALYERAERSDELSTLVTRLPDRYRAAVILRHVQGLGYAEVGEVLEQPVGTVKSNVHRGVDLLRRALAEQNTQDQKVA